MRTADQSIPLILGNLRQELEEEKALLRFRCREGDRYDVFPSLRRRKRKQKEVAMLLQSTIDKTWQQFKDVERPFLIKNPVRAEQVKKGGYWGESDVDEKPGAAPDRSRDMDMAEAGLSPDPQQRYYRTDMAHRFIWWQSKTAVMGMLDQVQRIQIRRIERDVFETDELVKRCLDRLEGRGRGGRSGSSGSGTDGGGGGGHQIGRKRGVRSRPGSARGPSRRGSVASGRFREVEETEVIRVRPQNGRARDGEDSNTGRRRETSRPRYEYETVKPGRISVEVDTAEPQRRPKAVPAKSYVRERDRDRYSGTDRR